MALGLVLALAAGLRSWQIGRESLWFDEVVSMRLARQPGPAALLETLGPTDATRAPLHPLALQVWVKVFGPSDTSGRAFSAACGVATVGLVFAIGRATFGVGVGLWGALLAAVSPLLVLYSRETRMYALLVLIACMAWWLRIGMGRSRRRQVGYAACLVALGYTHPLGLLMAAALSLASLLDRGDSGLSRRTWLILHAAAALLIVPWLPNYLDHPPDIASRQWLHPRYLIGLPIGFVGGDARALLACGLLAAWGLFARPEGRPGFGFDRSAVPLLVWFAGPTLLLYAYSLVSHPIFGPARYTLFVGPAWLLLLALGLSKLPRPAAVVVGPLLLLLAAVGLRDTVYPPGLKADWRAAAEAIRRADPAGARVVVYSEDPRWSREVEAAAYYLGTGFEVIPAAEFSEDHQARPTWRAVGLRGGRPVAPLPTGAGAEVVQLPGLLLSRDAEFK